MTLKDHLDKFNELCRICANKTNTLLAIQIFEEDGTNKAIYKKITECLPIKILNEDKLPKMICEDCVFKLDLLSEFREVSSTTDIYLNNLLKQIYESNETSLVPCQDSAEASLCNSIMTPTLSNISDTGFTKKGDDNCLVSSENKTSDTSVESLSESNQEGIIFKGIILEKPEQINFSEDGSTFVLTTAESATAFYFCTICSKAYLDRNSFDDHCASVHWNKCDECNLLFTSQEAYLLHCTDMHSTAPTDKPLEPMDNENETDFILTHLESLRHLPQQPIPFVTSISDQENIIIGKPDIDTFTPEKTSSEKIKIEKKVTEKINTESKVTEKIDTESKVTEKINTESKVTEKINTETKVTEKIDTESKVTEKINTETKVTEKINTESKVTEKINTETKVTEKIKTQNKKVAEKINTQKKVLEINTSKREKPKIPEKKVIPKKNLTNLNKKNLENKKKLIKTPNKEKIPPNKERIPTKEKIKTEIEKSDTERSIKYSSYPYEDSIRSPPETIIEDSNDSNVGNEENEENSKFRCSDCGCKFATLSKYSTHVKQHIHKNLIKDVTYVCNQCQKKFRSKIGLNQHEATHRGTFEYECNTCGKGFQCKSYLIVHQRVHSNDKPYCCTTCSKCFKTKQNLLDHENRHSGVKPYACHICGRGFITKALCKNHIKTHTGEINAQYECPICKKMFVSKSYLSVHAKIHTGDKPFSCDYCSKKFLTNVDLKIHRTLHTGEKSFVCETCGKAFARRDALRCHIRCHTGERPYRCNICGQTFTQFTPMAIHKRLHTGERPYSCNDCVQSFVSKSQLMSHQKKHTS